MSAQAPDSSVEPLPPLTPAEHRIFNRMSEGMDRYHEYFRAEWNDLYSAVSPVEWSQRQHRPTPATSKPAKQMSASRIINVGNSFLSHLTMHHGIEEEHIFPILAKKMPAFRRGSRHVQQHRDIHAGMDKLEKYLTEVRTGVRELRREEVRENMESWGPVLWEHLQEEVETLEASNMRRYWTLSEMQRLPM